MVSKRAVYLFLTTAPLPEVHALIIPHLTHEETEVRQEGTCPRATSLWLLNPAVSQPQAQCSFLRQTPVRKHDNKITHTLPPYTSQCPPSPSPLVLTD